MLKIIMSTAKATNPDKVAVNAKNMTRIGYAASIT